MANPTPDSDAATVNIKKEKICPDKSSKYVEDTTKFKFKLKRNVSMDINIIKIFRRFWSKPRRLNTNNKKLLSNCVKNIYYIKDKFKKRL